MGIAVSGKGLGGSGGSGGSREFGRFAEAPRCSRSGGSTDVRRPTCGRGVYLRADVHGVAGDPAAMRRQGQRRSRRFRRPDATGPTAGSVRYDAVPRHGAPGSRTSVAAGVSHAEARPRFRFAGFSTVVATIVVTVGVVVGLNALATLSGTQDGLPAETAAVQVRSGETLSDVASRVAPGAPVAAVVDRIRELNEMPGSGVRAGQTLLAPVALAG